MSKWKTNLVFQFTVTLPGIGIVLGEFQSVRGLGTDEWEFETYREGGDNGAEHILFSHVRNGKIVLERALRYPDPFVAWCLTQGTGVMISQPLTVTLLDGRTPKAMWMIPQSMLVKIEGPVLNAMSSEVAAIKIELIHNGLIPVPM